MVALVRRGVYRSQNSRGGRERGKIIFASARRESRRAKPDGELEKGGNKTRRIVRIKVRAALALEFDYLERCAREFSGGD